jgi:alcohol dehydrogenase, propanol-preferring
MAVSKTRVGFDSHEQGTLRLQPTVVGISKFNEACQALKNGKVAGRMVVDFNME